MVQTRDSRRDLNPDLDLEAIVASGAKGFGEVKLSKMTDAQIDRIARGLMPAHPWATRGEKIKAILAHKRYHPNKSRRASRVVLSSVVEFDEGPKDDDGAAIATAAATATTIATDAPRSASTTSARSCLSAMPPSPKSADVRTEPGVTVEAERSAFAPSGETLQIVAFNSLGLRFTEGDTSLKDDFCDLVVRFAQADVVMLSEVVPSSIATRVKILREALQEESKCAWCMNASIPSAGGEALGKLECHVVLVKAPLRLSEARTQQTAVGCKLDYAPHTVVVEGHALRLHGTRLQVMLTSVHMPPAERRTARDRQLKALLQGYERMADIRLNRPFTLQGAKERRVAPCVHVLMGDFNCYPGEVEGVGSAWRTLLPRAAKTSGGGKALDNCVVNADAFEVINAQWDVLALCRYSKGGVRALSDHAPIVLELKPL